MMLEAVKILTHGETNVLAKDIMNRVNYEDYELVGPVSAFINEYGKTLYTATLIKRLIKVGK